MRFCEIISESFLAELNKGIFDELPYNGFTIKFTTKPHFENGTQFGAVGFNHKNEFVGERKPYLANTKEEAIQAIKDLIDSDIDTREELGRQFKLENVVSYSMNFNKEFATGDIVDNAFNTYVKLYRLNGGLVLEVADDDFTNLFNKVELRNEGFYLLTDRAVPSEEDVYLQRTLSKKAKNNLKLIDRGRYIIINNHKVSDNDNPLYDVRYDDHGESKHDKGKINGPGFSIATTVKGGQD